MSTSPLDVEPVAPPPGREGAGIRAFVGAVFVVGGLGLIVCGGLFVFGAMCLLQPQFIDPSITPGPLSADAFTLLLILYAVAAACFLGAVTMFVLGVRGLLRIFAER